MAEWANGFIPATPRGNFFETGCKIAGKGKILEFRILES
jgi:hypothetical protein